MNKKDTNFIQTVLQYYRTHGRHDLPWRQTHDPYCIVVSEVMLQQTQVERVLPKYRAFLKQFPTVAVLAAAPLKEVLTAWQGLGYNRRAQRLHQCAQAVVANSQDKFPKTYQELLALPGLGAYTAGAVLAFAYNQAVPILETNIRTAVIYHYFRHRSAVDEGAIHTIITKTLPKSGARIWYAALMDYGAYLKRTSGNHGKQSVVYKKQTKFLGSDRQLRGIILKILTTKSEVSKKELIAEAENFSKTRIETQLKALIKEGMVKQHHQKFLLPS